MLAIFERSDDAILEFFGGFVNIENKHRGTQEWDMMFNELLKFTKNKRLTINDKTLLCLNDDVQECHTTLLELDMNYSNFAKFHKNESSPYETINIIDESQVKKHKYINLMKQIDNYTSYYYNTRINFPMEKKNNYDVAWEYIVNMKGTHIYKYQKISDLLSRVRTNNTIDFDISYVYDLIDAYNEWILLDVKDKTMTKDDIEYFCRTFAKLNGAIQEDNQLVEELDLLVNELEFE
jgi:hypothetical protein